MKGKLYDLEVHFVHYYKDSDANGADILLGAVVGIFFDTSDDTPNSFLDSLWTTLD